MATIFPPRTLRTAIDTPPSKPIVPLASNAIRPRSLSDDTYLFNRDGQEQWEREMRNVTRTSDVEVAVLLFSWENDREHSMNTENELRDLTEVFENKYNFTVHTKLLSTQKPQPPRYQLRSILNDFLSEYDRPNTLLIIYYGGHGMPTEKGEELRLLGGNPYENDPGSTELNWSDVEPALYRLSADLLLIFDCCFAGLVERNKRLWPASRSHFQFIGSTTFDKTARGPKSTGSFTRAMINSLNVLGEEEEFTTETLVRRINESKVFRETRQHPIIAECGKDNSFRRLKIRPVSKVQTNTDTPFSPIGDDTFNFYLHLKYVFKEKPSQEHLRALAERLSDMVKNDRLPIANVLWEGLSEYNPRMSVYDAVHMLKARLGHSSRRQPAGHLEISACTGKPQAMLQRTLTTLTMDDGLLVSTPVTDAEKNPSATSEKVGKFQYRHKIATLPFFFHPLCKLGKLTVSLIILALFGAIVIWRFSHSAFSLWSLILHKLL